MTLHVLVVHVKYSYNIIRTLNDVNKVYPYFREEIADRFDYMESNGYEIAGYKERMFGYTYNDKTSALLIYERLYHDTMRGYKENDYGVVLTTAAMIKFFLQFTRRLFIVTGIVEDDKEWHIKVLEIYDYINYKEKNKNEFENV